MEDIRKQVSEYYSNITTEKEGQMQTQICSCSDSMPLHIKKIRGMVNPELLKRFYGCGSPIPSALEGCTVLDLGCGTGVDVYVASKLVGESGKVIGVDMTDDQLNFAKKYQDQMAEKFGYKKSNVEFKKGYIEDLKSIGIEDESVDVVISNCVINLSPFKEEVFKEVWRVLKKGGELYFSDIFADRRVSDEIYQNPVLRGECLAGAMYVEDFRRLLHKIGWEDFRYTKITKAPIENRKIEELVGNVNFTSRTVRAVKLPGIIEDRCEQYGQFVTYRGGILGSEHYFDLDDHHRFYKDLPMAVCGNSCAMIEETRFKKYFDVVGDRTNHFGLFDGCDGPGNECDCDGNSGSCCC